MSFKVLFTDDIYIGIYYKWLYITVYDDEQTITSEVGFFQKIISFFKNLFRMDRTVIQ